MPCTKSPQIIPQVPKPNHTESCSVGPNQITWSQLQFLKYILQRQNTESCMMPQNEDLNVHHKSCIVFGLNQYNYILRKTPKM